MISLTQWQIKNSVSVAAMAELHDIFMAVDTSAPDGVHVPFSEGAVQAAVRAKASRQGDRLFRNNRGAGVLDSGSFVRFGLANDTAEMNKVIKSSDLIGIHRHLITPEMVGTYIGQFDAAEIKESKWRWTGTPDEMAQLAFGKLVIAMGGRFRFINDASQV